MNESERFWCKVEKTDSCWNWKASLKSGYGGFQYNGHFVRAHRASWHMHNGPIPEGIFICHKCDNPLCVNPEHLFLGTHRDNVLDAVSKGRFKKKLPATCDKGHEYVDGSYFKDKEGRRVCRECKRQRNREYSKRLAEARGKR